MRYFARETNGEDGPIEDFFMPQTPQEFAKRIARSLTSPNFLDGKYVFSLVVWGLPEGVFHVDDVPRSSPARGTYIQCGGSTEAMTIEIRITHDDNSYEQYTVARQPVVDPEAWVTVSWDNGGPVPFNIQGRSSPASRPYPCSEHTSRTTSYRRQNCCATLTPDKQKLH